MTRWNVYMGSRLLGEVDADDLGTAVDRAGKLRPGDDVVVSSLDAPEHAALSRALVAVVDVGATSPPGEWSQAPGGSAGLPGVKPLVKMREKVTPQSLPDAARAALADACRAEAVAEADVLSGARYAEVVRARHAWWATLRAQAWSWMRIARASGSDHSTVMQGVRRHHERRERKAAS